MAEGWTNWVHAFLPGSIHLAQPAWLLLLPVLLPALFLASQRSLAGMTKTRSWSSLGLRSFLVFLLVLSLADLQWVRKNDSICTIFVVDRSLSIPSSRSDEALKAVVAAAKTRSHPEDTFGVVVFGGDSRVESAPSGGQNGALLRFANDPFDRQQSDLAAGLRLARGLVPPGTTPRLVLLSDGNENRGNGLAEAARAREAGIPIDVVPLDYLHENDILVDKVATPQDLQEGEPIPLRVVLYSRQPTSGRLQIFQVSAEGRRNIAEQHVELRAGSTAITTTIPPVMPGTYTFEAEIIPDDRSYDQVVQNNRAAAFLRVQGQARILLVENKEGSHSDLADTMIEEKFLVTSIAPEQLPGDASALQGFDAVLLANVPADRITEEKQRFLAAATRDQGVGLVMIGGPQSFGAGNYFETPIEEVLPVKCTVEATVVQPSLDIVLVIDVSGSMTSSYGAVVPLDMAIRGGINTIKMLDHRARIGIVQFSGDSQWVAPLQSASNKDRLIRALQTMPVGGGTVMYPALKMAFEGLLSSKAMVRHVIVLSDGQSSPGNFDELARMYAEAKITLSTVAVGPAADLDMMSRLARIGKGQFYHAAHPATVPSLYLRELHRVYRPLIYENEPPWSPRIVQGSLPVAGLSSTLPPIRGFVLTTPKATADVPVVSPQPPELPVNPILAHWQVGLGKSAAVTTDAGERWASAWKGAPDYKTFWNGVVRWVQRSAETGELTLVTEERDGEVTVLVEAMDSDQQYLNFLRLQGNAVRPDGTTEKLDLVQTEPGRYVGSFPLESPGSHAITVGGILPDGKTALASTGLSVAYSREFRDTQSNRSLLENIASITGGLVVEPDKANAVDFFRRDRPMTSTLFEGWPDLLLIVLMLFLLDIAVRRIRVSWADLAPVTVWIRRRLLAQEPVAASTPAMQRLHGRKREVTQVFSAAQETNRKVATSVRESASTVLTESKPAAKVPDVTPPPPPEKADTASDYTSRLLAAKRNVKHDRKS